MLDARTEGHASPTIENYLQAVYSLEMEGETVFSAGLARRMHVTPPTAWATVRRMARDGLVELDSRKLVRLTDKGRPLAESIVRRHRLSERFLTDILGLNWVEAHAEAHLFEHIMSPRLEERIMAILGNPTHCPHGSPIPGTGGRVDPELVPLDTLSAGDQGTVEFISEELEEDPELLGYLERGRIMPGHQLRVKELAPSGVLVAEVEGREVPLGMTVAARIRVRPQSRAA